MHFKKQAKIHWLAVCASLGSILPHASAIITLGGTGENSTTPPNGIGSFEGKLGTGGGGTTIGPRVMLTATHVSGNTTGVFTFNNLTYNMRLAATLDDLAVWQIAPTDTKTFATYAPLYTGSSEVNLPIEVEGYGVQRGPAITGGWLWGAGNGSLSWGTNTVSAIVNDGDLGESPNFGGDFLEYDFNNDPTNPNEAITANGDSGGGVFVLNNGVYQLAGVNSLVDTVLDSKGNPIQGALYDQFGYYTQNYAGAPLTQITTHMPDSSFATRISSKLNLVGVVQGNITPANAAAFPINNDGDLSIYTSMTTGAITGGALLSIGTPFTPAVSATLQIAPNSGTSEISALTIASGCSFDITNNSVIIDDVTPDIETSILSYLASGYNNGKWNGPGITSSAAAASGGVYGVAYGEAGVVAGLSPGQVEIGYALYGDTNLDGVVNGDDFSVLVSELGKSVSVGWQAGDFNYDGVVNGTDFTLFMANFGRMTNGADAILPSSDLLAIDAFAAANHITLVSVPEPASAALLSLTGLRLLARRRHNA